MSEHENIEKVKAKRGILSRIQDFFTLGYGTKEDLRELDKKLRDLYHLELQNIRHIWEEVYLKVLDLGIDVSKRDLKKIRLEQKQPRNCVRTSWHISDKW